VSADLSTTTARERVIRLFEGDDDQWDRWVTASPDSTFCHLAGWRTVMRDALGHEASYLIAEDEDGSWRGVLPLVRVRSRIFGRYLLSMPFLNYGGPLGDELARTALARHAAELARQEGVRLLELRARMPVPGPLARADRKITVLLALPGTVDELWARTYKAKLRSQIRRPVKEGMTATFGADLVEPFYEVFARNMRDLGTPVLPRRFFDGIARHLGEHAEFCVVWSNGRPVADGSGFVWRREF
jgi:serine/alanine adding enzyme